MKPASAFALLLGQQSTTQQRERLYQVRNELGIGENDALWGLVQVIEEYCAALDRSAPPKPRRASPATSIPGTQWCRAWAFGMALQTFLMAGAFAAGARSSSGPSPTWLANHSWVSLALRVPAGWLIFVFLLPSLLYGVRSGWRARRAEPSIGWVLMASFSAAAAGLAVMLWWLMQG